jgi:transcriptional regulator with XRE-family HTH domain
MKNETFGQVFERYRTNENISISKVEDDTKISSRMINAIENNDYNSFPDDLYIRNLIKVYANYLSLDYNRLLALYEEAKPTESEEMKGIKITRPTKVYVTPKIIQYAVIILIVIFLLIYLGWQVNKIFDAPDLIIIEPVHEVITNKNFIEVRGETEKEAQVFINEKEIFLDANGQFKATLDLQKGLNIIKIRAAKKHSRENIIYREVLVQ